LRLPAECAAVVIFGRLQPPRIDAMGVEGVTTIESAAALPNLGIQADGAKILFLIVVGAAAPLDVEDHGREGLFEPSHVAPLSRSAPRVQCAGRGLVPRLHLFSNLLNRQLPLHEQGQETEQKTHDANRVHEAYAPGFLPNAQP